MIVAFPDFLNRTFTVADPPDARLSTPWTVIYGHPPKLPVAFVSVTPDLSELRTIWSGPAIVPPLMFLIVTVPLKL